MKAKDILKKFRLENREFPKSLEKPFLRHMSDELREVCTQLSVKDDIRKFDAATKQIRAKWDGISNKVPYGLSEQLWSHFWAVFVLPIREELCPKEHKKREERFNRYKEHVILNK